ncbi:MAG: class II fumarate hydratase [Kiritimatiellia bacterium]
MRIEKDALGEVAVPARAYYGAQTQRAVENFAVGDECLPKDLLMSLARVKQAAAKVNAQLGLLDATVADAIRKAADEVLSGAIGQEAFPLRIWQSGSGTQSNMNMNEVLANRANELLGGTRGQKAPVHPNDHVNRGQSTNDIFPTAMHVAAAMGVANRLMPALQQLLGVLAAKSADFRDIVKIGRTHLQDATPLTLGQEFSGYAAQVRQALHALEQSLPDICQLAAGGTAVGTGLNTHPAFGAGVAKELANRTGLPFVQQENLFAGLAAHDAIVRLSGVLRGLAAALYKIANDIRWLGSGPRSGLGELLLPANEPGSSIMPGKVNPTQCEMLTMICCRVFGNDAAIAFAGTQGQFELNVYKPLMAHAILQSINLLADGVVSFCERCLVDITVNEAQVQAHVDRSLMLVTALNPHIGYDHAAALALKAWREGRTLREVAVESGLLTAAQFDAWVQPAAMTRTEADV